MLKPETKHFPHAHKMAEVLIICQLWNGICLKYNARPYIAQVTKEKIMVLNMEVLLHPPYSPGLATVDNHLFRSLQNNLRENSLLIMKRLEMILNASLLWNLKNITLKGSTICQIDVIMLSIIKEISSWLDISTKIKKYLLSFLY